MHNVLYLSDSCFQRYRKLKIQLSYEFKFAINLVYSRLWNFSSYRKFRFIPIILCVCVCGPFVDGIYPDHFIQITLLKQIQFPFFKNKFINSLDKGSFLFIYILLWLDPSFNLIFNLDDYAVQVSAQM